MCVTILRPDRAKVILDKQDLKAYNSHRWHVAKRRKCKYLARNKTKEHNAIYFHRLITNCPKGKVIDHMNGNGLDNRRSNLRICTQKENVRNNRRSSGTSKFKGVHLHRPTRKWRSQINKGSQRINIGLFDTQEEAARAYDRKAKELFGKFAQLNNVSESRG